MSGRGPGGEFIEAWLEFELEADRWGVPVTIPRAELEALVEGSAAALKRGSPPPAAPGRLAAVGFKGRA